MPELVSGLLDLLTSSAPGFSIAPAVDVGNLNLRRCSE